MRFLIDARQFGGKLYESGRLLAVRWFGPDAVFFPRNFSMHCIVR